MFCQKSQYERNVKVYGLGQSKGEITPSRLPFQDLLEGSCLFLSCIANLILYDRHKLLEKVEQIRRLVFEEALTDLTGAVLLALGRELAFPLFSLSWEG